MMNVMKKFFCPVLVWVVLVAVCLCNYGCEAKQKKPFTFVVLPDIQYYTDRYPEILDAQIDWISSEENEVQFAIQLGDITNRNKEPQWKVAAKAFEKLDGKIPYVFVPGNHDMGPNGNASNRDTELYNTYFPYEKYSKAPGYGGCFEEGKMDNTYHSFSAGGYNWLILCLEFGPREQVLDWGNEVISKHTEHKVIVVTHAYMYSDDSRMNLVKDHDWVPQKYGVGKGRSSDSVNDGEEMWDKMVKRHKNIVFVFSGHVCHSGVGTLVSAGDHDNNVYQMLSNFQTGVIGSENGGNGFLRQITVNPEKKEIIVRTYSPYLNKYMDDVRHNFSFEDVDFL